MDDDSRMHLDDDKMSLQSKIAGGGRDLGEQAGEQESRLCPACGRVTTFVQGKCSNCDYKIGQSASFNEATALRDVLEGGSTGGGAMRVVLVILVLAALGVIGYFVYNAMAKKGESTPEPAAATTAPRTTPAEPAPATTAAPDSHPGTLSQVTLDDDWHASLRTAIASGNDAWKAAGKSCFAYRYRVTETLIPAQSQTVSITLFCGGKDATACLEAPDDEALRLAMKGFTDKLAAHDGVASSLQLAATGGDELADPKDVYLRYGYYYGKEHMDRIQSVIDSIENRKSPAGSYPIAIDSSFSTSPIKTEGGLGFVPGGFGYLPVFETDGSGNIVMGSGSGLASFEPKSVKGYYLLMYTTKETDGLDLYSAEDLRYYTDNILPFPYQPEKPIHNMRLKADGKADGIACVVKDGKLQE